MKAEYKVYGGTYANDVDEFAADGYESVSNGDGTYGIAFIKLEQEPLKFKDGFGARFEYLEGFGHPFDVTGGSGSGEITYEIIKGDAIKIDRVTRNGVEIIVLKAGECVLRATKAGNDTYLPATAEIIITVTHGDREITFAENSVTVPYGTLTYTNEAKLDVGTGEIVYSIVQGDDIASIDKTSGELTFKDGGVGTVKVQAFVKGNECYADARQTYTLTVETLKIPKDPYELDGKKGDNGWYRSDVVVEAKEGYTLSTSNDLTDNKWSKSLTISKEGERTKKIYLKNADGAITDVIEVNVKIDKTAPDGLSIDYANQKWTLGSLLGGNKAVDVTFNVTEEGSGIAKLEYSKDGETYETVTAKDGKYTVTVEAQYRGQIAFKVTDKAGWETRLDSDGNTLIVDSIAPKYKFNLNGKYDMSQDLIQTAEDEFTVVYEIEEANADLLQQFSVITVSTKDGGEVTPVWEEKDGKTYVTLTFTKEGDYEVAASFYDYSNEEVEHSFKLRVDRTPAEVAIKSNVAAINTIDGVNYFDDNVTLNFQVRKYFFEKNQVSVAVNFNGKQETHTNSTGYPNNGQWNSTDVANTMSLSFKEEGEYTVSLNYKEWSLTGWADRTVDYSFVIDRTAPTVGQIQYKDIEFNWVDRLKATFGFSKETVSVTISAQDNLSGIHYLEYSVNGEETKQVTSADLFNNGYTFEIEPEYRGTITVKAFDKAGRNATLTEQKTLVVDNSDPVLSVGFKGAYSASSDNKDMLATRDDDFRLIFTASDTNFDIRKNDPQIQIRKAGETEWTDCETAKLSADATEVTVELPEDGVYEVRYLLEDWLSTTEKIMTVNVDRTGSTIDSAFAEPVNEEGGISYYSTEQGIAVEITDANFDAAGVDLKVTLDGESQAEFAAYARDAENWTANGNTYTLKLSFEQEGTYNLSVKAKDALGNDQQNDVYKTFVVDLSDPENLEISYELTFVEVVGGLFGFANKEVTAVLTAEDPTSDLSMVEVSVDGRNYVEIKPDANGAYKHTVDAQYRDHLTLRVTNKAGRVSILRDDRAVVVDTIAPEIFDSYSEEFRDFEGIYYSNSEEFPVELLITDANYDLRAQNAVVTLDGTEQELTWTDGIGANDEPYGTATVLLANEGINNLHASFDDRLNPVEWAQTVVLDRTAPVMDITFSGELQNFNDNKFFFKSAQTATISIDEINFLAEEVVLKVTDRDGNELTEYAEAAKVASNWKNNELKLDFEDDDIYTLEVSYTDLAGNAGVKKGTSETTYKVQFVVDTVIPTVDSITYSQKAVERVWETVTLGFFNAPLYATVAASDDTAGVNTISYKGEGVKAINDPTEVLFEGTQEVNEEGKITFEIQPGFCGQITAWAMDYSNNKSDDVNVTDIDAEDEEFDTIVVDNVSPEREVAIFPAEGIMAILDGESMENLDTFAEGDDVVLYFDESASLEIQITEDNFYADNYTVAVNEVEQEMQWNTVDNVHTALLTLSAEGDYVVTVTGTDNSGNEMTAYTSQRIVIDHTAPTIDVAYECDGEELVIDPYTEETWDTEHYLSHALTATITITEHNFRADEVEILVTAKNYGGVDVLTLTEDGVVKSYFDQGKTQNEAGKKNALKWSAFEGTWRREGGQFVIDLVFNADANYTFAVAYTDLVGREASYEQRTFSVDNEDPVIIVDGIGEDYYGNAEEPTVATIKIQDENLDANKVEYAITAVDAAGENVEFTTTDLKAASSWTYENGIWTATVPFPAEANYTFTLSYTDRSGRVGTVQGTGAEVFEEAFTVDYSKPIDLSITYQDTEKVFDENGTSVLYFANDAKVTLTAHDITTGMMNFYLNITPEGHKTASSYAVPAEAVMIAYNADLDLVNKQLKTGTTGITVDSVDYADGWMTVVLNVPEEFRGSFSFDAVDLAGQAETVAEDNVVVVTDSVKPERSVELKPTQMVSRADMKNFTGELKENSDVVLYYNGDAEIKLTLTEANFYDEEPVFTVNDERVALTWIEDAQEPGTYHASHTLQKDGDYIVKLTYTDRSGNVMDVYTSQRIVVDTTAPQVSVSYDNNNVKNTIRGREYYDNNRVATITVHEKNFRADDVKVMVTSTNVAGANVANSYEKQAVNRKNWSAYNGDVEWRRDGDTYVLKLTYSADANYTFDIEYKDMATNAATYGGKRDYTADVFTVDHKAPEKLKISYSMEVLETILDGISFGFYDAKMTVTLRAEDATAGIHRFVYSYVTASGTSGVNSGKNEQVINENNIKYSDNGRTATATFNIPQTALNDKNQFNGTVNFTAYDRSMNNEKLTDKDRIVVDNISPVGNVSYNKPVQTVDGVAYYSGKIEATITINEANFYRDDVTVSVTRDGANYSVKPTWTDTNADVHVGRFVLDKEGDYIVTIRHTDKSGNSMKQYVSGKMIIDLEAPSIQVSDIVPNSANKDDTYSFSVTVNDADGNMRAGDIAPSLTYVVRDENGNHTTEKFDLGGAAVVASGKTFTYTVEDLPEDGIYTLECTAKDLAGNTVNAMTMDDGTTASSVRFSINRHGSTFEYGDAFTRDLDAQYYVQNVKNDLVIREINVDPVEQFTVTVNGKALTNGVDYKTSVSGGGNTWSVRTYTISKSLFAEEGEYNVVVSSVDAANTTVFSDMKNLSETFVVDRTPPTVVLGGLEQGGRYQVESQTVTLIPSDEGGQLATVRVELFDDGADLSTAECTAVLFESSGEELMAYLNEHGGIISFDVPEGYQHQVRIICTDYAQGDAESTNEYVLTFEDVTVSTDKLVIFYAHKPLFYSTVFGVLALLAFIFFMIFKRKKRAEEENADTE